VEGVQAVEPGRDLPRLEQAGMGTDLEVEVLPRAGHSEGREAQGRKGDRPSEGSVERTRGPMDKNRIGGAADRGERAKGPRPLVAPVPARRGGPLSRENRRPPFAWDAWLPYPREMTGRPEWSGTLAHLGPVGCRSPWNALQESGGGAPP